MDTKRIILCILLFLCTVCSVSHAATLTESYTPRPAILGNNNLTVRAGYTLSTSEALETMSLLTAERRLMALFTPSSPSESLSWRSDTPQTVRDRATAHGSAQLGYLEARFGNTKCEDINSRYLFQLSYYDTNRALQNLERTVTVSVEARPKAPTIDVTPNTQNVTEYTNITITCSGNVGRPAGSFQWFTFNDDVSSNSMNNVTDQADPGAPFSGTGEESCTFTRTSVLTLNVTRRAAGKRLVVRCRVYHPTQGNSDYMQCQNPDSDYCQMTQQIDVQYPVEVTVDSDAVNAEEGKETTLTCHVQGNPDPYMIEWNKEGDNETLSSSNSLQLTDLQLNDTGTYICTAYNTVAGTTRNASRSIYVSVQKTTTPPPTTSTTTPASTTKPDGGTAGQVDKGDTDKLSIIIPVVVVAVVLIIVIIVVIIIIKRRNSRKEVEEPPEKPFNNHAGINTVATRPDIVSNAYTGFDNPNGYKNEDGLTYAELQFDNKPRSRRPLAIDDSHTDYSDVSMPQV